MSPLFLRSTKGVGHHSQGRGTLRGRGQERGPPNQGRARGRVQGDTRGTQQGRGRARRSQGRVQVLHNQERVQAHHNQGRGHRMMELGHRRRAQGRQGNLTGRSLDMQQEQGQGHPTPGQVLALGRCHNQGSLQGLVREHHSQGQDQTGSLTMEGIPGTLTGQGRVRPGSQQEHQGSQQGQSQGTLTQEGIRGTHWGQGRCTREGTQREGSQRLGPQSRRDQGHRRWSH